MYYSVYSKGVLVKNFCENIGNQGNQGNLVDL